MVDGFDNKATLFCYVDFVFVSFLAILKMSFCYETPCIYFFTNKWFSWARVWAGTVFKVGATGSLLITVIGIAAGEVTNWD